MMPGAKLIISPLQLIFRSTTCLLQCKPALQSKFLLRNLSFGSVRKSSSKDIAERPLSEEKKSDDKPEPTSHDTSSKMVRAQYIDKKSLVWDKRYKSMEDVPEMLPYQTIVQARNRFRIRANLVMIALTVVAALVMIYTGKERAKSGDTVEKRIIERHRQLRLQKAEEDRAAAAAAGAEK